MFEVGMTVRLVDISKLGKATSPMGIVKRVNGDALEVIRDGIKTPKWYKSGVWQPAVITEHDSIREAIRATPWEFAAYLVYADELEMQGKQSLGQAWRWMGRRGKKPRYIGNVGVSKRWEWIIDYDHDRTYDTPSKDKAASMIPGPLLLAVARTMFCPERYAFQTDDQAIAALAEGLETLTRIAT